MMPHANPWVVQGERAMGTSILAYPYLYAHIVRVYVRCTASSTMNPSRGFSALELEEKLLGCGVKGWNKLSLCVSLGILNRGFLTNHGA